jgi:hypothetical protein
VRQWKRSGRPPQTLVTHEGDSLMVMDGAGALFVLDAARGDVKERFDL